MYKKEGNTQTNISIYLVRTGGSGSTIDIWFFVAGGYSRGNWNIDSVDGEVYKNPTSQSNTPSGTVIFDSNSASYPPNLVTEQGNIQPSYITRSAHNTGYLVGGYNNLGASSYNISPIYSIGTSYTSSSTSLGNIYGIGYGHSNATGLGILYANGNHWALNGWGCWVADGGVARIGFNATRGSIKCTGTFECGPVAMIDVTGNTTFFLTKQAGRDIKFSSIPAGTTTNYHTGNHDNRCRLHADGFYPYSDDRIKRNEKLIVNATKTLKKLTPQIYDKYGSMDLSGDFRIESGLIAQEIYYNAPELRHLVNLGVQEVTSVHYVKDASDNYVKDASGNSIMDLSNKYSKDSNGNYVKDINGEYEKETKTSGFTPTPEEMDLSGVDIGSDPDYGSHGWSKTEPCSVNYMGIIPYLIKSNQELEERLAALENKQRIKSLHLMKTKLMKLMKKFDKPPPTHSTTHPQIK